MRARAVRTFYMVLNQVAISQISRFANAKYGMSFAVAGSASLLRSR